MRRKDEWALVAGRGAEPQPGMTSSPSAPSASLALLPSPLTVIIFKQKIRMQNGGRGKLFARSILAGPWPLPVTPNHIGMATALLKHREAPGVLGSKVNAAASEVAEFESSCW